MVGSAVHAIDVRVQAVYKHVCFIPILGKCEKLILEGRPGTPGAGHIKAHPGQNGEDRVQKLRITSKTKRKYVTQVLVGTPGLTGFQEI